MPVGFAVETWPSYPDSSCWGLLRKEKSLGSGSCLPSLKRTGRELAALQIFLKNQPIEMTDTVSSTLDLGPKPEDCVLVLDEFTGLSQSPSYS